MWSDISFDELIMEVPKRGFYDKSLNYSEAEQPALPLNGWEKTENSSMYVCYYFNSELQMIEELRRILDEYSELRETVRRFLSKKVGYKELKRALK